MVHLSVTVPLVLAVLFAVYKVVSSYVEARRYAVRGKQLHCQDAPEQPDSGFLGYRVLKQLFQADKDQRFPDFLVERQAFMSEYTGRLCTTFYNRVLGQKQFFTSDPENIKAMLATQFNDFDLGPTRAANMGATLGSGIFVQDGKAWEHSRAMLRPNFVREQVSDLELEERHLQELMQVLPVQADGWTAETNIQRLFFRLTIDSATEFLFGKSSDSQLSEARAEQLNVNQDEKSFSLNFDSAQAHLARRFRFGDFYWFHNPKSFRDNNKVVKDFVRRFVDETLSKSAEKVNAEKDEKYVFLKALASQTRDPEELTAQLLNILLAGRDTTASLLSWLFHELLRNPDVFTELRKTIVETFGTYDEPRDITFTGLKNCQYLQNCLNETLRLWTVVPGNSRRSNKETTLPRGGGPDGKSPVLLQKDTEVNYSVHVMMRRKDLWGEDADKFRPERFVGRRFGWEYLPFNGGPRICIGQQFALTEASYVVVRLLQRFDAISARPEEFEGPVRSNLTLTSCPGRPVTLRLREAKRA